VLVALQQGSHGLLQRVQPYRSLVDVGVFELTSLNLGGDEVEAWASTLDALNDSEQVLSKMLELIGGGDGAPTKVPGGLDPLLDGLTLDARRSLTPPFDSIRLCLNGASLHDSQCSDPFKKSSKRR
jgi:hypothetical protein